MYVLLIFFHFKTLPKRTKSLCTEEQSMVVLGAKRPRSQGPSERLSSSEHLFNTIENFYIQIERLV